MLTVIVAEDQMLIQKDICRKIEKTGKDVQIAATAINGQDAYEKILKFHPDILITDIRMPIQSGLELIRRLREENISIQTVILSGYRDFEYAKEAMKLNVDEYLLKPVSVEDLYFILDSLEKKLDAQKDHLLKEAFGALFASRPLKTPPDILENFSCSAYYLALVNLDSYCTFSIMDTLPIENELSELFDGDFTGRYLSSREHFFVFDGKTYNEKILMFCLETTAEKKLLLLLKDLKCQIEKLTQCVTICISPRFTSLSFAGMECRLLRTQIEQQLIFEKSAILSMHNFLSIDEPLHTQLLTTAQAEKFLFYIQSHNPHGFLTELDTFLKHCKSSEITQKDLSLNLKNILQKCFLSLSPRAIANAELEIDEYLSISKTYQELYLSLSFLFEHLFKKVHHEKSLSVEPEQLVADIKKYIEENYTREININDIAVHFAITPAYLSRLFKKHSDTKPIDYLTNCRISQACRYFVDSQLSVKEIAQLCGYSNQYYFSKAFKQETSLAPTEYRIKYKKPSP
ncbi:MAG: response regulator [Eubacteriales bacterium]|nr:response regulator [Eubacteriales bacterium]